MIKINNKILYVILAIVFAVVSMLGCAGDKVGSTTATKENTSKLQERVKVETAVVKAENFQPEFQATGTLFANRKIVLKALVGGEITFLNVDIGSKVKKQQLLFEIRKVNYELELQQAEANLARAKVIVADREREKNRIENLYKEGSATEQMRDQIITAYEEALAGLKQAEAARARMAQMLADCSNYSPYDGIITARFVQKGVYVNVGDPVVELTDLSVLNAEIEIPEIYAGKIKEGQNVIISFLTDHKPVTGKIVAVNPKINIMNRTFLVKAEVDNKNDNLHDGMFCTATFKLPVQKNIPSVPVAAVIHDEGRSYVWVISDGKAHYREVKEGDRLNGYVMIVNGLKPGETIVISGFGSLSEGQEINN